MRFLYIKLTGYIGIYNGLGLSSIEIDFTRCKNRLVVISGPNGVGKTTLLNAMTVIPDENYCFVPSMEASKYIRVLDGENIYDITTLHPLGSNNKRGTTKASIIKNGLELNPNGNITSYKEIIFTEFELDSNYIALSRLSGEDRGIADKKPAERRRFVSAILDSLDTYNALYKNFNKKTNIFKSYINNLSSKIQSIGDENYLASTLASINNRVSRLEENIDRAKDEISKSQAILAINKVDEDMQARYAEAERLLKMSEDKYETIYDEYDKYLNKVIRKNYPDIEDTGIALADINNIIQTHENTLVKHTSDISSLSEQITNTRADISRLELKINKLKSEIDEELIKTISQYRSEISTIEEYFSALMIKDMNNITPEEIQYLITLINDIVASIDAFYESTDSETMKVIKHYKYDSDQLKAMTTVYKAKIDTITEYIENSKSISEELKMDGIVLDALDHKPDDCNNSKCFFISNAIQLLTDKYGSIEKYNERVEKEKVSFTMLEKDKDHFEKLVEQFENCIRSNAILDGVIKLIDSNTSLLSKLGVTLLISSKESFLAHISKESRFNPLRNLNRFYDMSNELIEYKSKKEVLSKLEAEYKIQENNMDTLKEYESEYTEKQSRLDSISNQVNALIKDREFTRGLIEGFNKKRQCIEELIRLKSNVDEVYKERELRKSDYNQYKSQFQSSANELTKISDMTQLVNDSLIQIKPLKEQRKIIESQLTILSTYRQEYAMYTEKYAVVDKLKKYSSPRDKDGIQEIFMKMYMHKTLDLANNLLGMIFNGQYRLLDYIISDGEFRMPFVGNGLPVDDISSGSTSQVCIMGMIINLVMRNQASTRYNITSLDEIDGGLDHNNRYLFVDILQRIIDILGIEQLFIISHSVESALSNVDVILLSNSIDYTELFSGANVIFHV